MSKHEILICTPNLTREFDLETCASFSIEFDATTKALKVAFYELKQVEVKVTDTVSPGKAESTRKRGIIVEARRPAKDVKRRGYKRNYAALKNVTPQELAHMYVEYVVGDTTAKELASKFNNNSKTVSSWMSIINRLVQGKTVPYAKEKHAQAANLIKDNNLLKG